MVRRPTGRFDFRGRGMHIIQLGVEHLVDRGTTHLFHRLPDMGHADDVGLGELAAVGVDRDRAALVADRAGLDEGSALALGAEPVVLELHEHHRGEVVVEQRDVDVGVAHPGPGVETLGDRGVSGGGERLAGSSGTAPPWTAPLPPR
jgi:hypothetical protein